MQLQKPIDCVEQRWKVEFRGTSPHYRRQTQHPQLLHTHTHKQTTTSPDIRRKTHDTISPPDLIDVADTAGDMLFPGAEPLLGDGFRDVEAFVARRER